MQRIRAGSCVAALALFAVALSPAAPSLAAGSPPASSRMSGQFAHGTHLVRLDNAPRARDAGFNLVWGYVSWQQVEPTRNSFLFNTSDHWGSTGPNPLSNVLQAAKNAGTGVIREPWRDPVC